MALPSSGAISLADVNVELGRASTTLISLNEAGLRSLFGIASGSLGLGHGYGKANAFSFTISTSQNNLDIRAAAVSAGWNQVSKLNVTIGSGVSITSASTGTAACTIAGSFPGGIALTNNGSIIGKGGNGNGNSYLYTSACVVGSSNVLATAGGIALAVSATLSLTNNGTIGGGGGGGSNGGHCGMFAPPNVCGPSIPSMCYSAGGAGGGGAGYGNGGAYNAYIANQGAGVSVSTCQGAGNKFASYAGSAGGLTTGGAGGAKAPTSGCPCGTSNGGVGGAGGGLGASGAVGTSGDINGGACTNTAVAGAGGSAVSGNSYITWVTTGARYGAIA